MTLKFKLINLTILTIWGITNYIGYVFYGGGMINLVSALSCTVVAGLYVCYVILLKVIK